MMQRTMDAQDIAHLAALARIELAPDEVSSLQSEIADIVGYVSDIQSLTTDAATTKEVGPVHNVFRPDVVTNNPNEYTERLLGAAPETEKGYVLVKKILNPDEA